MPAGRSAVVPALTRSQLPLRCQLLYRQRTYSWLLPQLLERYAGLADLPANMHREVAEETGIDLAGLAHDDTYHGLHSASGLTLVRRYYLDEDSAAVSRAVSRHIESDSDPEIDDVVVIHSPADVPESAPAHMEPLVRWHFSADKAQTGS